RNGVAQPFPIQAAVIPDAMSGRDVTGRAPTGSGKTLAFGLPLVAGLDDAASRRPVALVLSPTRELAEQIVDEVDPYVRAAGHRSISVYGGVGYGKQTSAIKSGAELVVACPGRLEDLIESDSVDLSDVTTVVIDEADQMADMGFLPAVRRIVDLTRSDRQVMLFSATLDGPVAKLVADYQTDPARHEIGPVGPDLSAAHHLFWNVDKLERNDHAAELVQHLGPTIVFVRTRHGADRVAKRLTKGGVRAEAIHGGRNQNQRDRALAAFKKREVGALIATDVAARGIHVDGVEAVVHYDPPNDGAVYQHRSGRTARAGATGIVVSFVDRSMKKAVSGIQKELGLRIDVTQPDLDEIDRIRAARSERSEGTDDIRTADLTASAATHHSATDTETDARERGVVKFFNAARGYGFIQLDRGGDDLFVHHTNIAIDGFRTLDNGARISCEVRPGRRGPEAFEVTLA
ncbi:MAG: DEAD/DEAH box helicase, partial [Actinomycetota bacterium]